jgi:Glycosyltransferase family 9 (heptosyltransferase)
MLDQLLAYERTKKGWCGLTKEGELLVVKGEPNLDWASKQLPVNDIKTNKLLGQFEIPDYRPNVINSYIKHFKQSIKLYKANYNEEALIEIDAALSFANTTRARFNRTLVLLALEKWEEGFELYRDCETYPMFMRPQYSKAIQAGIKPWNGENITGKKLLVMHDHGYGDTIMMLRYMTALREMGIEVVMQMPKELVRIAAQHGHVVGFLPTADYCCSILMLIGLLRLTPATISWKLEPYIKVYVELAKKWNHKLKNGGRKKIGVAWTVGKVLENDFPRSIPPKLLVEHLSDEAELISVQQSDVEVEGIRHFEFEDFADCAALMSQLDEIVSVDTAAVHLAGAIGHPKITLLLSHWASWRWLSPWYENVTICKQDRPKDWHSALAKRSL